MSQKFRLDRKTGFQNTFYTKCINVIIDSIGPSIILRSILLLTGQGVLEPIWILVKISKVDWYMLEPLLLLHV